MTHGCVTCKLLATCLRLYAAHWTTLLDLPADIEQDSKYQCAGSTLL